jgi:PAS domain S-box-containing protein
MRENGSTIIQASKNEPTARVLIPAGNADDLVGVLGCEFEGRDRIHNDIIEFLENIALSLSTLHEGQPVAGENGESSEGLSVLRNLYLDLRQQDAIRLSFLENVPLPACMVHFDGTIRWCNREMQRLVGYYLHELEGMKFKQIIAPESYQDFKKLIRKFSEGHPASTGQFKLITKGGSSYLVEQYGVLLQGEREASGVGFILRDVSEDALERTTLEKQKRTLEAAYQFSNDELRETQFAAILAMARLVESIDEDTEGHIDRVRHYSRVLTADLRTHPKHTDHINDEYIDLMFHLSPLHDVGKVGIPDSILKKPGKLTADEFKIMETHTTIGADALRAAGDRLKRKSIFAIAEMIARYHHSKWDGSGYPAVHINGEFRPLRGEEIPLSARIVALADVYDALSSKRPYKDAFPHKKVREIIIGDRGIHFDPDVVDAFIELEEEFQSIRRQYTPGTPEYEEMAGAELVEDVKKG